MQAYYTVQIHVIQQKSKPTIDLCMLEYIRCEVD